MRVAGIDGCRSGWIAVLVEDGDPSSASTAIASRLEDLLETQAPGLAVIDVPIGLTSGPTDRDVEAAMRSVLPGRTSSVFNTPCRQALSAGSYPEAVAINSAILGKSLSKQTWAIMNKIAEADAVVRASGQSKLREGHPEVSFACLAGGPVREPKRDVRGQTVRRQLLEEAGFPVGALLASLDARFKGGMDDVLDACALAWSAMRLAAGSHVTLPSSPSRDGEGLEMSIIA